jgi:hypothetical protein
MSVLAFDAPTRPVMRYHGGKFRLAPWILSFAALEDPAQQQMMFA